MTFNYDVIVVGAGHAGRAAADDEDVDLFHFVPSFG